MFESAHDTQNINSSTNTTTNGENINNVYEQTLQTPQYTPSPTGGIIMEKYNNGFKPKHQLSERDLRAKKYIFYMFATVFIYIAGFAYFILNLEYECEFPLTKTDAIITLTGETKRITDSIAELARGTAPRLFISGVHRQAPIEKVINKTIANLQSHGKIFISTDSLKSRIETGRAENTIENALESAVWVGKNNISSVRIMTSFYHLPRVRLLFDKYLPKTTKIYHPITFAKLGKNPLHDPKVIVLLLSEYNKYLITYLWNILGLETKTVLTIQGVITK